MRRSLIQHGAGRGDDDGAERNASTLSYVETIRTHLPEVVVKCRRHSRRRATGWMRSRIYLAVASVAKLRFILSIGNRSDARYYPNATR